MTKEINAADWDQKVLGATKPVVVEFWHESCPWCLKLAPIYNQLSEEYDRAELVKLNVLANHENQHLAVGYGVSGTPTMKVFCDGREIGETVGYMEKEALRRELDRIVEKSERCLSQSTALRPGTGEAAA